MPKPHKGCPSPNLGISAIVYGRVEQLVAHRIGNATVLNRPCVFEPRPFRHFGSIEHVAGSPRLKRDIPQGIGGPTPSASAILERFGIGKPPCFENRRTERYCAFDSRPLLQFWVCCVYWKTNRAVNSVLIRAMGVRFPPHSPSLNKAQKNACKS